MFPSDARRREFYPSPFCYFSPPSNIWYFLSFLQILSSTWFILMADNLLYILLHLLTYDVVQTLHPLMLYSIKNRNSSTTQKLYISQLTTTLSSKNINKNYLWHPTVTGLGHYVLISCSGHSSSMFPSNPPYKNLKSLDGNATKRSIT